MWNILESKQSRFINFQLFRGSSKTTTTRSFMARRISYGISRTILLICASSAKAEMTLAWLKRQVETNYTWANTFRLVPGDKWTDVIVELRHNIYNYSVWVVAFGLTGKHRGINLDDYRPDLIIVDDIIDEEIAASDEQRQKAEDLVLGSLKDSLISRIENPDAKLVLLQTPFHPDDLSMKAFKSRQWISYRQGCWTKDTEDLPLDRRISVWEEMFPTADLREERLDAIADNKVSLFSREKECKIVAPETATFRREWLRFYTDDDLPENYIGMQKILAVDPVPPPTETDPRKMAVKKKDFECHLVLGYWKGNYYVLDYRIERGHTPEWTIMTFFNLLILYRVPRTVIEAVAYQATLMWLLAKAMEQQKRYAVIEPFRDKRRKPLRIADEISGIASNARLYVKESMHELITQFTDYPNVDHDDILDALAMALMRLTLIDLGEDDFQEFPGDKPIEYKRGAP
jgi:phage terminase large subunit-like protein